MDSSSSAGLVPFCLSVTVAKDTCWIRELKKIHLLDRGIEMDSFNNFRYHPHNHEDPHYMIGQVLHQLIPQLLSEWETVWRKVKC